MVEFMERTIVPRATKIANNKYLLAIRDAFIGMLAITMIGSFAALINELASVEGFKWFGNFMIGIFGPSWRTLNDKIYFGTLACISIFLVFGLSNRLAKSLDSHGFEAMLVSGACYFVLLPQTRIIKFTPVGDNEAINHVTWGMVSWSGNFDGQGIFIAMITAVLSTVIFVNLSKIKLLIIKLPDGVPPTVSKAFAQLLPGMLTIVIFALFALLFGVIISPDGTYATFDIHNSVQQQVMKWISPEINKVDSLLAVMLIVFLNQVFSFVGLQGSTILLGVTSTMMKGLVTENAALYANGIAVRSGSYHIMAGQFLECFVYLGGSGATLGLLLSMVIFTKKKRRLIGFALPPGIFQINEPVLYGLPIVLNPTYFIPFIIGPIILAIISYLAVNIGLVHPVVITSIPWGTPIGLGGYLLTGGHVSGAILPIVNLIISVIIYAPFVIMAEKMESKEYEGFNNEVKI